MLTLAVLSAVIWVYLIFGHGRFWQAGPVLTPCMPLSRPGVTVVVPARDEAASIDRTLRSLLAQDYPGPFRVILVDDQSTDATADIARRIGDPRLTVVAGAARPAGWSGKLWAVFQGIAAAGAADFIFLTDADIVHQSAHLSTLVARAERDDLDLVSEMVELACVSWAECALVPAFVFFFQLLYPFTWVNDSLHPTAAAAGGTILVRNRALRRIGGIEAVRGALIDDVTLAKAVKQGGRIWLGHSALAKSIRPYPTAGDIWRMIARTAYVQLRYSPLLLLVTTIGMVVTWLVPPYAALFGSGIVFWLGLIAWALSAWSYGPTLRRFGRSAAWAAALPAIAVFYMAATIGSAVNHYRGKGVAWKGRAYQGTGA